MAAYKLNGQRVNFRISISEKVLLKLGNFTLKEAKARAREVDKAYPGVNLIYVVSRKDQKLIDFQT